MNRVKYFREKRGMTQEELAEKAGISRVSVSNIECDKVPDVKVKTLRAIAEALNAPIQEIFLT